MLFYHPIEHTFGYTGRMGEVMTSEVSKVELSPEVVKAIDSYKPRKASGDVWADHGDIVRDRVRAVSPKGVEIACRLIAAGASLLAYAAKEAIPLDDDIVFSDETIERYTAVGGGGTAGSSGTIRSRLRRLSDAYKPNQTAKLARPKLRDPYKKDELRGLWQLISNQTPSRTRRLQGLYCLSLGAGCDARDLRTVRGTSVRRDNDNIVYVTIGEPRPRRVPVLSDIGDTLLSLAEEAKENPIIGGDPKSKNLVNNVVKLAKGGQDLPKLDASRLRHSWLVAMIESRIPLPVIAKMAGLSTIHSIEDLLAFADLPSEGFATDIADAMEVPWL